MGRKLFDGKDYEEVIRKLETAWALGCADTEAALLADISSAALCEFLKANSKISERKAQLKETPILKARAQLHKSIHNGDGKLALQYLERARNKEFAPRSELSGPDGISLINIDWANAALSNPELAADISKLMGKIAKK